MLEDVMSAAAPGAPFTDEASRVVVDGAVASLGTIRALQWLGEGGSQLHLLASLRDQIDLALGDAVVLAREQGYTETEIVGLTTQVLPGLYAESEPPANGD